MIKLEMFVKIVSLALLLFSDCECIVTGKGNQEQKIVDTDTKTSKTEGSEKSSSRSDIYEGGGSHSVPVYSHSDFGYGGGDFGGHSTGIGSLGYGSIGSYGGSYGGSEGGYHHYAPHHHHHHDYHHSHKSVALKGLLVPLAGVALLGAAAALVSNPVLLQIGVISGKRRRRDTNEITPEEAENVQRKLSEIALLEKFIAEVPREQAISQEKHLLANYLLCSSNNKTESPHCIERLVCELTDPNTEATALERRVLSIVTTEILGNEYIPSFFKERVTKAAEVGSSSGDCNAFPCKGLED